MQPHGWPLPASRHSYTSPDPVDLAHIPSALFCAALCCSNAPSCCHYFATKCAPEASHALMILTSSRKLCPTSWPPCKCKCLQSTLPCTFLRLPPPRSVFLPHLTLHNHTDLIYLRGALIQLAVTRAAGKDQPCPPGWRIQAFLLQVEAVLACLQAYVPGRAYADSTYQACQTRAVGI